MKNKDARRERLAAALETFKKEKFRQSSVGDAYREDVEQALKCAEKSLEDNELHKGWGLLGAARRLELLTLTPEALRARAAALAHEARKKLEGWRKQAAAGLLPKDGECLDHDSLRAHAWLVQALIDGRADNEYFKQQIAWEAVQRLLWILVFLVVIALVALTLNELLPWPLPRAEWPLIPVALFGAIGACFSGIRSLSARNKSAIPEAVLSTGLTRTRPIIGAAAAIVVFLALESEIFNVAMDSFAGTLTVSFVAGFSESLVVRVVEAVEKVSSG